MKVFRNNNCYVTVHDLFKRELPSYFKLDIPVIYENGFIVITDQKSIDYLKEREDILNYDDVKSLTEDELNEKVNDAYITMDNYAKKWMDSNDNKTIVSEDRKYLSKTFISLSIYNEIKNYQCNRISTDKSIESITNKDYKLSRII